MKPTLLKAALRHSFAGSTPIRALSTGLPSDRLPALRKLLAEGKKQNTLPLRIIETHSGLTGLIAEHAKGEGGQQYDGMWSSSLTASAACGMPDIEAVDTTSRLGIVKDTLNVTTKPMIYDGDTGGLPEIFKFTVRQLEQLGVSAVIIEDKEGLKQNSLLADSNALQNIIDIDEFCVKIKAGLEARRDPNFMIIARMESLIAGLPMETALSRAAACVDAGASGIMIHSRKKSPEEVVEFIAKFRASPGCEDVPVVVVPSSYNAIYESELREAGASICIYANHLLRASYPAMLDVAETILSSSRCAEATPKIMSIKEITNFITHDAKYEAPTDTGKSS